MAETAKSPAAKALTEKGAAAKTDKNPASKNQAAKNPAAKAEKSQERQCPDFAANPSNYVNRELSWLEFNYRVLSEARDKSIPLFERLKFLSITASNLDEF